VAQENQEKTVLIEDQATSGAVPARPAAPYLAHAAGPQTEAVYWLSGGKQLTIGRAPDNDVCLPDQGVSQHHARVGATADGTIVIEDLGSTNGTFVNGERIARRTLRDGDQVLIRPNYVLKFGYRANPAPETPAAQEKDATRDALTGLYSRQYLLIRMDEGFFLARKQNENLALLMFEVDQFAKLVETHGPAAGEMVLCEVAKLVGAMFGREDVLARYENHVFGAILRGQDDAAVVVLAQRIRRSVKYHHFVHNGERLSVTVSLGLGSLARNAKSPMDFLSETLSNLAKARRAGRDTINGSQSLRDIVRQNGNKDVA